VLLASPTACETAVGPGVGRRGRIGQVSAGGKFDGRSATKHTYLHTSIDPPRQRKKKGRHGWWLLLQSAVTRADWSETDPPIQTSECEILRSGTLLFLLMLRAAVRRCSRGHPRVNPSPPPPPTPRRPSITNRRWEGNFAKAHAAMPSQPCLSPEFPDCLRLACKQSSERHRNVSLARSVPPWPCNARLEWKRSRADLASHDRLGRISRAVHTFRRR